MACQPPNPRATFAARASPAVRAASVPASANLAAGIMAEGRDENCPPVIASNDTNTNHDAISCANGEPISQAIEAPQFPCRRPPLPAIADSVSPVRIMDAVLDVIRMRRSTLACRRSRHDIAAFAAVPSVAAVYPKLLHGRALRECHR
jgi:hypothetical protein